MSKSLHDVSSGFYNSSVMKACQMNYFLLIKVNQDFLNDLLNANHWIFIMQEPGTNV